MNIVCWYTMLSYYWVYYRFTNASKSENGEIIFSIHDSSNFYSYKSLCSFIEFIIVINVYNIHL